MVKAMYAFSGDPITFGHIDIIKRASETFDDFTVGIGVNPDKKYMFSLEERTEMAKAALSDLKNVRIVPFQGLLVDYAYENGISVLIKGVRNSADFDYENVLHQAGESQKLGIDTHILFARPNLAHVSSSMVKAIQKEQGLIHEYVPLYVKQCLEAKMSGQYIIGVTGEIGAGKSYVSKKFEEIGKARSIEVHNIELDHIGHEILEELKEPAYVKVRDQIAEAFRAHVKLSDGRINRKALGEVVFNDKSALETLDRIMYTPMIVRLRRELYGKKGLILLNAALIAEADWSYLCNNNAVLISVDKKSQERRLGERGLNRDQIQRRLESQYSFSQKYNSLNSSIKRDNQGHIWKLDNSDNSPEYQIVQVFDNVVKGLGVK